MKKIANSVVRHSKNIPNGKQYRKLFNSWDISDWRFVYEKDDEWYAKSKRK